MALLEELDALAALILPATGEVLTAADLAAPTRPRGRSARRAVGAADGATMSIVHGEFGEATQLQPYLWVGAGAAANPVRRSCGAKGCEYAKVRED